MKSILTLCMFGVLFLSPCAVGVKGQEGSGTPFVHIEGLRSSYSSCAPVDFSVRNISQQEIDVEVYAENSKAGSWIDVDCQYDINHPRSEYAKLSLKNRQLIKPGASVSLSYDRCSAYERCERKRFGKKDARALRQTLEREDAKSPSPVVQRFRVVIHVREQDRLKKAGKEWSQPFTRAAEK
jgi:hypothetical protein